MPAISKWKHENHHWVQPIYDVLKGYKLPLNGYANDKIKDAPVTRGTLAQVFATAVLGKPTDLRSAVQFMYDNGLATARNGQKTYESYNVNEILNRGQISAFFMCLDAKGFTEIKVNQYWRQDAHIKEASYITGLFLRCLCDRIFP
ncbi:hypothetical protein D0469_09125 [Peribacillus saganii]|uniref:SLH domain-containing protein n=1 Tax=Peribacillus saganii TaxID=2303992 RepID=A0A372LP26_9BACI|nr:hypothetical protein [Peribacillus saganii]RFU69517.1 hypothetical protein D0469_09125 [Peribacillus saganii]